ncbi:FAD-dependent oxidoreductase [Pseudonocardia eucalypti]|uniref:FAD-dependent oxidoreductase n=1 Tax=Pseudonocardia eucalypti TaxID=648755 RepID=A0ABP9PGT4_9PSEU|nr:2,4-dienoyl-CoA reductase (NADPH2) [Pseudonocardia eucalypti]
MTWPLGLRSPVVFTAHLTNFAEHGLPTERHAAYYAARAAGGVGMIITEEHCVHPSDRAYQKVIQGYRPDALPGYRTIVHSVHAHGIPILAQLNHHGGQGHGRYSRRAVWAPSAVPDPLHREVPVAIDADRIGELVASYAEVAARCRAGGFDGVEIQASQSSIVRQFLSPAANRRTDAHGGDLPGRARFLLEVVAGVRAALGPEALLGVRLGPDALSDEALAETVEVARLLADTGAVSYLNSTVGVAGVTQELITPPMGVPAGYALPVARALRAAVDLPVLGVGRFTEFAQVERVLVDGDCDLVGVVRGLLADPGFAGGGATRCVGANSGCVGRVGLNRPIGCLVNPRIADVRPPGDPASVRVSGGIELGRLPGGVEPGRALGGGEPGQVSGLAEPGRTVLAREPKRVLVIGGGPGGLRAAVAAAELGHSVTLCERSPELGGQLAVAALAPGRAELGRVTHDLASRARALGVTLRASTEATPELVDAHRADVVVLATGARPEPPPWAIGERVAAVSDVLTGDIHPSGRVLVYDELGGPAATGVAELLASRGNPVEIVTPMLAVAPDLGLTLEREPFLARAAALGIRFGVERLVESMSDGTVTLRHHLLDVRERRECDWLVYATPPRPDDRLWSGLSGGGLRVHRVGDCLAPRDARAAIRDGDRVGRAL